MTTLPRFPVEGGCVCGAVRYRLTARPLGVYACHCKDCQRSSGTGYAISAMVETAALEVITGTLVGWEKRADSGRIARVMRCAQCGTNVWNEPLAAPHLRVLRPGTLDDSRWAAPVGNIWTDRALPWVVIDPNLPHFPGQPADRQPLYDAFAASVDAGA